MADVWSVRRGLPQRGPAVNSAVRLFEYSSAAEPHWGLGQLLAFGLPIQRLSWQISAQNPQGEVPPEFADLIVPALLSLHQLHFLVDEARPSSDSSRSTRYIDVSAGGLVQAVYARLHQLPPRMAWCSTGEYQVARDLFAQSTFAWTNQAQVVLLSDRAAAPLRLSRELTIALLRGGSPSSVEALAAAGVTSVLRPVVDGDGVGWVNLQPVPEPAWVAELRRRCEHSPWAFRQVRPV